MNLKKRIFEDGFEADKLITFGRLGTDHPVTKKHEITETQNTYIVNLSTFTNQKLHTLLIKMLEASERHLPIDIEFWISQGINMINAELYYRQREPK